MYGGLSQLPTEGSDAGYRIAPEPNLSLLSVGKFTQTRAPEAQVNLCLISGHNFISDSWVAAFPGVLYYTDRPLMESEEQCALSKEMLSRRLAVILHSDVVGSTDLVQKQESIAHQRFPDAFHRFSEISRNYSGVAHHCQGV